MIRKFSVKNYKGFKEELSFDFTEFKDYKFNKFAIKDNKVIKNAIIYGENGSGKSNFGLALFDLTLHLTDKERIPLQFSNYLNGDSDLNVASFSYEFELNGYLIKYSYEKSDALTLVYEDLYINDEKIFSYNFNNNRGDFPGMKMIGTESLKINDINISVLRYFAFNANLKEKSPILLLMDFVNNMLWFRTTIDGNQYIGMKDGSSILTESIIKLDKVREFEIYLKNKGIKMNLEPYVSATGEHILISKYNYKQFDFLQIASHGTKVLLLYFYWLQKLKDASFVFIDEFDAFFHTHLSETMFLELSKKTNSQMLITTHNTDMMTNNLLRPDCYLLIANGKIKSLPNYTDRELREGHNLEKMYKSGIFDAN